VYVLLNVPPDGNNTCLAYQTFHIATSGQLTFRGATTHVTPAPAARNLPTFLANNKFAYAVNNFAKEADLGGPEPIFVNGGSGFARESNGTLTYRNNFDFSFPPPYKGYDLAEWIPQAMTTDPTNHLAVAMYPLTVSLPATRSTVRKT
jgi:hypothetical protein